MRLYFAMEYFMNRIDIAWDKLEDWIISIDEFYTKSGVGYLSSSSDLYWKCSYPELSIKNVSEFIEKTYYFNNEDHWRFDAWSDSRGIYIKRNDLTINSKQIMDILSFDDIAEYGVDYTVRSENFLNGHKMQVRGNKLNNGFIKLDIIWSPVRLLWHETNLKERIESAIDYFIEIQNQLDSRKLILYTDSRFTQHGLQGKYSEVEI